MAFFASVKASSACIHLTYKYIHYILIHIPCNSTSCPRREDERGVKGVRVLAMVGTTMSKRYGDTGALKVVKGEELYKDKGRGLGV